MATDNFNRADGGLGANWTDQVAGLRILGNNAAGLDAVGAYQAAWWNANTPSANHYSEITIGVTTFASSYLIGVRMTPSGSVLEGIFGLIQVGSWIRIYKFVGGTPTQLVELDALGVVSANEVYRHSVTGTSYVLTRDSTPIGSPLTDSTFSTGTYGVGALGTGDLFNAWAGDDVAGSGSPQIPFLRL